jgi:hypothetical protein
MKECTFKPEVKDYRRDRSKDKIQNHTSRGRTDRKDSVSRDKCQELFELSKTRKIKKEDKSAIQVEYEKFKEECTFQPNAKKDNEKENNSQKRS